MKLTYKEAIEEDRNLVMQSTEIGVKGYIKNPSFVDKSEENWLAQLKPEYKSYGKTHLDRIKKFIESSKGLYHELKKESESSNKAEDIREFVFFWSVRLEDKVGVN